MGVVIAAVFAISISARSGVGLTLALTAALAGLIWATGVRSSVGRWCLAGVALMPWLVIRDSTWLAISIVCTTVLLLCLLATASSTNQTFTNLSLGSVFRRPPSPHAEGAEFDSNVAAIMRGTIVALPIVAVFWMLLASADDVFAAVFDPSGVPIARLVIFAVAAPIAISVGVFAANGLDPLPQTTTPAIVGRFGVVESTVVLGAVSTLFAVFVTLRFATLGRSLDDAAFRTEVRSGFFQLLWVAGLTVLLVLAVRQVAGSNGLTGRLRQLGWLTIALAAIIDCLALLRIVQYVQSSFISPLRFWSFGFGVWLLVLLGLTALRLTNVRGDSKWFTAAAVTSWMAFLFVLGAINPDQRIAQHIFDNAPTGEDEWIAVKPLMWLSEDATTVIVENVEVLRPMPNDRYVRVVDHLCTRDLDGSWRDWHLSRQAAKDAIEELC